MIEICVNSSIIASGGQGASATVTILDGDTIVTITDTDANTTIDNEVGEVIAAIKADVLEVDADNFTDHSPLRQLWSP